MIEKKTVIDKIEILESGEVLVRFGLLIVEDGVTITTSWHRTSVEPGIDVDRQLAEVDANLLAGVGKDENSLVRWPVMDKARVPQLKSIVDVVHTPQSIQAYRRRRDQARDQARGIQQQALIRL